MVLTNKLKTCKSLEDIFSVLDELGDRLLKNDPSEVDENNRLCEILSKQQQHIKLYLMANKKLAISADELKYCLKIKRADYYFYHSHTDEYKAEHFNILVENLPLELAGSADFLKKLLAYDLDTIEKARKRLTAIQVLEPENSSIWISLMIISKYYPLNLECTFTLEAIPAEKRVFTSSGHQFNIDLLFEFYDGKFGLAHDGFINRFPINIIPNNAFSVLDSAHLYSCKGRVHPHEALLPNIYDMNFIHAYRALVALARGTDIQGHYLRKMAALPPAKLKPLIHNIERHQTHSNNTCENDFLLLMNARFNSGLSVEVFANYDLRGQEIAIFGYPLTSERSSQSTVTHAYMRQSSTPKCIQSKRHFEHNWEPGWDRGDGVMMRGKGYVITDSNCIECITITWNSQQGLSLIVLAGQFRDFNIHSLHTEQRNSVLIESLSTIGFNAALKGVKDFPKAKSPAWNCFLIAGNPQETQDRLALLIRMIKELEGQRVFGDLEDEIMSLIPSIYPEVRARERMRNAV